MPDRYRPLVDSLSDPVSPRPLRKAETHDSGLHALRSQLEDMSDSTLRSVSSAMRESRKLRAAMAFAHALSVLGWSQRETAKHVGCDEKDIRHWLKAVAQPTWIPLALPRAGYVAFLQKLADEAPPSDRTGTYG